ncbi:MAG: T9SS type A sorting domain-containing protein [Ferruginibacter sp.]|nr:T9SS type A sorting domain-containing protein [Ferruginibacter sp.]
MRLYCTLLLILSFVSNQMLAQQKHIVGPPGSGSFGQGIKVLPNGNYVVTDPSYDDGLTPDVGAVYLYNGETHALISTLKGTQANDAVGNAGITILANGHFVIRSLNWNNGSAINAGAVTWGNADTGVEGVVSAANSLVGSQSADFVGSSGVLPLPNGNYLVRSGDWDNGTFINAGAVTWGDGNAGVVGVVSSSNSLVGNKNFDQIGVYNIVILSNGHYVVCSPLWDNVTATDAGAVTWGNGNTGISGVITAANSLIGSKPQDLVGFGFNGIGGITPLPNGNYVVRSPRWANGVALNAGAVTFANGSTGITGLINASNSLVGNHSNDYVGMGLFINNDGIQILPNGNYVVTSPAWNNNRGAVTWCSGVSGLTGVVSSVNSLVGGLAGDQVGSGVLGGIGRSDITVLSNGNYVVSSPNWWNGSFSSAGAVTLCNGAGTTTGIVGATNSLVGTQASDRVGNGGVKALTNGNYVVISNQWNHNAITGAGAVTWCNGLTGLIGTVSASNSLVGGQPFDRVGNAGVTVLTNGNYVVASSNWANSSLLNAGAATWGDGTTGISGLITSANSLVGDKSNDQIGNGGVTALTNGNYVVRSLQWGNGMVTNAGAVTWGNGTTGITGSVSASNSLVGSQIGDQVGSNTVQPLYNGNYVVGSMFWDNGSIVNAGAVSFGNGASGVTGVVSASNSLVGTSAGDLVGGSSVFVLPNGNYIVNSSNWNNSSVIDAGAVTFCNGTTGLTGAVSESNSLVGGQANDNVGNSVLAALTNGNYLVRSLNWKNGPIVNAGAYTIGDKDLGISGTINNCNSVTGNSVNAGFGSYDYNSLYDYVIVGIPSENRIVIYTSAENAAEATISSAATELNCNTPSIELTASGGTQYSWSGGLGNSATAIVTTPGIYTVTVSDINGCTDEAYIEITQNIVLPATPVVSGPVNVCMFEGNQTPVSYSVLNDPNATSYEWVVPPTTTLVSGQGTSSIEIEINTGFSISANKQIRVRAISGCGNSAWTIYYLHAQAPTTPATISGLQEVCSLVGTGNETTYSIQPVSGATSYVWSVPSGVTVAQDNGTSIDVIFESSFNNGNIRVLAQNNCGVSTFRSIAVSKTLPSTPGLISGPTNMCLLKPDLMNPFGSTAEYKISLVAGATSYAWSLPPGITLLNQYSTATENIAFVEIGSGYNGGNIGVVASNNCGTSNTRVLRLNVLQPGAPPAIDVTELSVCPARIYRYSLGVHPSNSSYIQWSVPAEAEILNGFYTNTIEVLYPNTAISGEVTASAINGCGVSSIRRLKIKLSACQEVLSKSAQDDYDIFVYPNPSSSSFNLDLGKVHSLKGLVEMIVTDVLGRVLYANRVNAGEVIQFGNELKPGTYLIEIKQGTFRKVSKIVKL